MRGMLRTKISEPPFEIVRRFLQAPGRVLVLLDDNQVAEVPEAMLPLNRRILAFASYQDVVGYLQRFTFYHVSEKVDAVLDYLNGKKYR